MKNKTQIQYLKQMSEDIAVLKTVAESANKIIEDHNTILFGDKGKGGLISKIDRVQLVMLILIASLMIQAPEAFSLIANFLK